MYVTYKKKLIVSVFAVALTALACGPLDLARDILGNIPTATLPLEAVTVIEAHTPIDWYVATDGDNANSCTAPDTACLTLAGAVSKSRTFDRIFIAAGEYLGHDGTGERLPSIFNKNLTIIGEGSGGTILNANEASGGIKIYGTSSVSLQGLTIQNTSRGSASGCIETSVSAGLTLEDAVLQNCWRSGLTHNSSGVAHLVNVIIANARDENTDPDFTVNGSGIVNTGELIIEGGEINNSDRVGIENAGPLTVTGTTVQDSTWGGVESSFTGASTFTNVTIANNGIRFLRDGMFITAGTVTISGSTITSNGNQAIFLRGPVTLRMDTSTISDHPILALNIFAGVTVELDDVTINNNGLSTESLAIIRNEGNLTINNSRIIDNFDSALYSIDGAIVTISDSEISGNRSNFTTVVNRDTTSQMFISRSLIANNIVAEPFLAAVSNDGRMELENTTISNNNRAGIRMDADTTLSYVTIAENTEVGINQGGPGPFTIANSLIAKNGGGNCTTSFAFYTGSLSGNNIDTDGSCGFPETYSPADIRLARLADNGGPTFTHELLRDPDSPAIDAAQGACPATDQRNATRPIGAACDVGAYEAGGIPLSVEESAIVIGTPDGPDTVIIITTTPCYNGPGPQYGQFSSLAQGISMQLVGAGFTGNGNQDWVIASHPTAANTNCWVPSEDIETNIPFDEMRLITVPGLPTPTPQPTSDRPAPEDTPIPCYYDQNNALICP